MTGRPMMTVLITPRRSQRFDERDVIARDLPNTWTRVRDDIGGSLLTFGAFWHSLR
jgi:hypothetical protein